MANNQILKVILALPELERLQLINELTGKTVKQDYISVHIEKLMNKQVGCPHCNSLNFYRFGKDKGCLRFMCKECKRS